MYICTSSDKKRVAATHPSFCLSDKRKSLINLSVTTYHLKNMLDSQLDEIIRRTFDTEVFADCQLLEIKVLKNNAIEIIADADEGMSLEKCRNLSRTIENAIDEVQILGDDYTLEVSSPGVDRPLKFPRQYTKHIGRTLEIALTDTETTPLEAKLIASDIVKITVSYNIDRKEGKKKIKESFVKEIPFSEIKKALVVLSFK